MFVDTIFLKWREIGDDEVRTHHDGEDEDVTVFEGIEGRRSVLILVSLAHFQSRYYGSHHSEHQVVEYLHRYFCFSLYPTQSSRAIISLHIRGIGLKSDTDILL